MTRIYRKPNWKKVEIGDRDQRLFKTIGDEGFVRRDHAIKYIFWGNESYAKIRIRKLKRFDYLKAVPKEGAPESYLLGPAGVEAVRKIYPLGLRGCGCPSVLESIDPGRYEHSWKVTEVRLLFENLGFCTNWQSERMLRAGRKGGWKVPDGFFTWHGLGIAIEVELRSKTARRYQKIFEVYRRDEKIDCILYLCGDVALRKLILKHANGSLIDEKIGVGLYDDFLKYRENTQFKTPKGDLKLKALFEHP